MIADRCHVRSFHSKPRTGSRGLLPLVLLAACGSRGAAPAPATPGVAPAPVDEPVAATRPVDPPAPVPEPAVEPPADDVVIESGQCPAPPGAHVATAEDRAAVLDLMRGWLAPQGTRLPAIDYQRGVVFVESEEDRGDDPPYPRSAEAESERACGSHAEWLRSEVRERLRWRAASGMVRCDGVVCCYDGMEYAPNGYVVFRPSTRDGEVVWTLDAAVDIYEAALGEEEVAANRTFVTRALAKLDKVRCKGEPAVVK